MVEMNIYAKRISASLRKAVLCDYMKTYQELKEEKPYTIHVNIRATLSERKVIDFLIERGYSLSALTKRLLFDEAKKEGYDDK